MDLPGGSGSKPRQPRKQKLTPRKEYPGDHGDIGETPRRRLSKPTGKPKKSLNSAEIEELVMDSDSADDVFGEDDEDEPILRGLYTRGDDEDDSEDDEEVEEDEEGEEDENYEGSEEHENEEDENYEASEEDDEESEDDYEITPLPTQRSRAKGRMYDNGLATHSEEEEEEEVDGGEGARGGPGQGVRGGAGRQGCGLTATRGGNGDRQGGSGVGKVYPGIYVNPLMLLRGKKLKSSKSSSSSIITL